RSITAQNPPIAHNMPRHRLAALFAPRTVLVLADRPLPLAQAMPRWLQNAATVVTFEPDGPIVVPDTLAGVAARQRLELAVVCAASGRLPDVLDALRPHRPRGIVLLQHEQSSADAVEDMVYCRSWGALNDCAILGPRSFGLQRPHLGLNASHQSTIALTGRVALVAQSRSKIGRASGRERVAVSG